MKLAVLVSGGGTNLQAILDQIDSGLLANTQVSVVISSSPEAYALVRAKSRGIATHIINKKNFEQLEEYDLKMFSLLVSYDVDLVVLAGFLSLLGPRTVEYYNKRMINIHPSLIPAFCGPGMYGLRPHCAAIDRGVKISGATVHFVDDAYDEGPIILQKAVAVETGDTPQILQKRIMEECEQIILPEAIRLIEQDRVIVKDKKVYIIEESKSEGKV